MKFTTFLRRIILGIGALSFFSFVRADFATCLDGWQWSYNSLGQNPCEIAGSLQAPCLGYSVYVLGPLSNGTNYVTPQVNDTSAKKCGCNTVVYSLYDACSACQFDSTYTPLTWQFWSQFCDNVYVTQYPEPIPFNASVPHWAFLNDTNPGFNRTLAQAAGRDPEATPTTPPTVALSSSTSLQSSGSGISSLSTRTIPNPSSTTSSGGGGGGGGSPKSRTGAIAGGVIGGVAALALLSSLALFFAKRQRGKDPNAILAPTLMGYNPTTGDPIYEPPKLYNPSDPSTFPTLPSGGDSSNSGGYTTNPYQDGRYTGAAEL